MVKHQNKYGNYWMNETGFPEQMDKSLIFKTSCEYFSIKFHFNMYMEPHAPIFYIFSYFIYIVMN